MKRTPNWRLLWTVFSLALFWGWNLLLLSVIFMGLGPVVMLELFVAVVMGLVPAQFGFTALVILLVPLTGVALGLHPKLRADPKRLLSLLYGVQIPVLMVALLRLFAIHELVPTTTISLLAVALGAAGLLLSLLFGFDEKRPVLRGLRVFSASIYVVVGAWWAVLTSLFVVPLSTKLVLSLPSAGWSVLTGLPSYRITGFEPVMLLFLAFWSVTMFMLLMLPFATFGVTARALQLVLNRAVERSGPKVFVFAALSMLSLPVALYAVDNQPQRQVFEQINSATTDEQRRQLLSHLDEVRQGLLAARLGPDRFLDADSDGEWVRSLWGFEAPQWLYQGLIRPFAYQAVGEGWYRVRSDGRDAEAMYRTIFDAPMQRTEREAMLHSETTTWNWRDVQAGLLSIGARRVRLASQEVNIAAHDDHATVSIHDVWRNQGFRQEEILLAFSLPESAAVTGLWLGHEPDRDRAFKYIVAPRGAAQEVYENEVSRRVDPALLEQVGPGQYRLRAFPIEPRDSSSHTLWDIDEEGADFHLWLEITVPAVGDSYPMPALAEARNAFWTEETARTVNGEPATGSSWVSDVKLASEAKISHRSVLDGYEVKATPAAVSASSPSSIHVLIDDSASMVHHLDELERALSELRAASDIAVFCTRDDQVQRCDSFDPRAELFWAQTPVAASLSQYLELGVNSPSALVVLTDEGSYDVEFELEGQLDPTMKTPPPLWLVHFGGYPTAYVDWVLDRITRSGGGVGASVSEVLLKMADPLVVDGWRFEVVATDQPDTVASSFDSVAARALVAHLAERGDGALSELDALHEVAVKHHIISPWSSMIVLVQARQKLLLEEALQGEDRFEREATGGEAQSVSAVPEPETWLLLILGGAMLLVARTRARAHLAVS